VCVTYGRGNAHLGLDRGQKACPETGDAGEAPEQCEGHSVGTAMEDAICLCAQKNKTKKKTPSLTNCYCFYTVYCKSFTACFYNPFYFILQDTFFIDRIFTKKNFMYKILA